MGDLDGRTIDYTYEGGWRFRVRFYDGLVAYDFLGDAGEEVSNSNADIPYRSRKLADGSLHVAWQERNIGDFVTLIIDEANRVIYSAAVLGYREDDGTVHFERGQIHSFEATGGTEA